MGNDAQGSFLRHPLSPKAANWNTLCSAANYAFDGAEKEQEEHVHDWGIEAKEYGHHAQACHAEDAQHKEEWQELSWKFKNILTEYLQSAFSLILISSS